MLLVYYALRDHHRAASFVRMSSQCKWHAGALFWPSLQSILSKKDYCMYFAYYYFIEKENLMFEKHNHDTKSISFYFENSITLVSPP